MKDHEIADLVNALRDVAVEFHDSQQLRERIAQLVVPAVKQEAIKTQSAPVGYLCYSLDGVSFQDYPSDGCEPVFTSAPTIPEGWTACRIEFEPGYPEDLAFGPPKMMERLKKWLDKYYAMLSSTSPHTTEAVSDVLEERRRQVEKEGWTPDHDDQHQGGELCAAGGCYALYSDAYPNAAEPPPAWPWAPEWWKPKDFRRDLVRAAALVIAEIERMDRAAHAKEKSRESHHPTDHRSQRTPPPEGRAIPAGASYLPGRPALRP